MPVLILFCERCNPKNFLLMHACLIMDFWHCLLILYGAYSSPTTFRTSGDCSQIHVACDLQETQYYWTQDTTEVCFSNNHFWTALLLGVPGVLIVCLGIPAWFAGVLYRGRHDLDNLSLQRTYGFLYLGYK